MGLGGRRPAGRLLSEEIREVLRGERGQEGVKEGV